MSHVFLVATLRYPRSPVPYRIRPQGSPGFEGSPRSTTRPRLVRPVQRSQACRRSTLPPGIPSLCSKNSSQSLTWHIQVSAYQIPPHMSVFYHSCRVGACVIIVVIVIVTFLSSVLNTANQSKATALSQVSRPPYLRARRIYTSPFLQLSYA